tara:strand:- start:6736 stop:7179 length:444 start_codon:yes stop_codon:yes gene_type:complete
MMTNINDDYKKDKEVKTGTPMLQLRNTTGTNQLHIQGWGSQGNREYGYARKFTVPPEVTDSLAKYDAKMFYSLASPEKIYYRNVIGIVQYSDGYQINIELNDSNANNGKCWTLDINLPQCSDWINWLDANNLISDATNFTKFTGGAQ